MRPRFYFATTVCLIVLSGAASDLFAQSFVTGRVYRKMGDGYVPIPHAHIEALSDPAGDPIARITADALGHYMLSGLPAGDSIVVASHPRYYPARVANGTLRVRVNCGIAGSCGKADFELIPNGVLEVTATDPGGDPVEGLRMTIRSLGGQGRALRPGLGQRMARGVFRSFEMRPGRYWVRAEPTGRHRHRAYQPVETEVLFGYGQTDESIRLVMPFTKIYRVSGVVQGVPRQQATDLLVVLTPQVEDPGDGRANRLGAPLDEDGRFALSGVSPGLYSVSLVPVENSLFAQRGSPQLRLGVICIDNDLVDLEFELPAFPGQK